MIIINVFKVLFLLGFLIFIHEFAHFLVARLCGVKVIEFSIGFGKVLYKKEIKNTMFVFRILPLGGYVNLKGLDEKNSDPDSYTSVSIFKRILIILAGAICNIVFGLILFFILMFVLNGFKNALILTGDFFINILNSLKMLLTGNIHIDEFVGPIGISSIVSKVDALVEFIYLLSAISISLGFTNLLPIPGLDGYKFIFLIIEAIRRKPFSQNFEYISNFLGAIIIISLSIYIAYNDILKIF